MSFFVALFVYITPLFNEKFTFKFQIFKKERVKLT
jgi:hypothetical protein